MRKFTLTNTGIISEVFKMEAYFIHHNCNNNTGKQPINDHKQDLLLKCADYLGPSNTLAAPLE